MTKKIRLNKVTSPAAVADAGGEIAIESVYERRIKKKTATTDLDRSQETRCAKIIFEWGRVCNFTARTNTCLSLRMAAFIRHSHTDVCVLYW